MIAGMIGAIFRVAARFVRGEAGRDLDHVGAELRRLERSQRRRQELVSTR